MTNLTTVEMRQSISRWLQQHTAKDQIAFSAHYNENFSDFASNRVDDYRHKASENNRWFLNYLNSLIFKNRAKTKRGNMKVLCMPVIEKRGGIMHTHMLIGRPDHISLESMQEYCIEAWKKTKLGSPNGIYVEANYGDTFNQGYGQYILKEVRWNNTDAIDVPNLHLN